MDCFTTIVIYLYNINQPSIFSRNRTSIQYNPIKWHHSLQVRHLAKIKSRATITLVKSLLLTGSQVVSTENVAQSTIIHEVFLCKCSRLLYIKFHIDSPIKLQKYPVLQWIKMRLKQVAGMPSALVWMQRVPSGAGWPRAHLREGLIGQQTASAQEMNRNVYHHPLSKHIHTIKFNIYDMTYEYIWYISYR